MEILRLNKKLYMVLVTVYSVEPWEILRPLKHHIQINMLL